jgi:hypothetical protein
MAPAFARFEQAYGKRMRIVEINVDDRDLVERYGKYKGTAYIPETVVLRGDKIVTRQGGAMDEEQLEKAVVRAL